MALQLDFIRSLGQVPDSPFPFLLSFPFTLSFSFPLLFVFSIKNLNIRSRTPFDVPELSCCGSPEYFKDIFEGLEFHRTSKIAVSQMLSEWDMGLRRFAASGYFLNVITCNPEGSRRQLTFHFMSFCVGPQFSDRLLDGILKV
ncbi:hypothetical protein RclHR1_10430010 [Rhizophagus clarus]|uniref:Uncharacterized protein n=1 Tax=Rhizophagus clarus TaxID=94130 RepID=A0A2Z6Q1V8_9GLOM|nr:hypothetical protein RclHR1_10430010 [Rhizophagus clarus]